MPPVLSGLLVALAFGVSALTASGLVRGEVKERGGAYVVAGVALLGIGIFVFVAFWAAIRERVGRPRLVAALAVAILGAAVGVLFTLATREPGPPCEEAHRIPLEAKPSAISSGELGIWVAANGGLLYKIERDSREVEDEIDVAQHVGQKPFDITQADGALWVTGNGTIARIDPSSRRLVWKKTLGKESGEVEIGLGGAWYKDYAAGTLTKLDIGSGDVIKTIEVEGGDLPNAFTIGDKSVWVAADSQTEAEDRLLEYSAEGELVRPVPTALDPQDLVEMGNDLYVNHGFGRSVTLVNVTAKEEQDTTALLHGGVPGGIAADADHVWVPGADTGTVDLVSRNPFKSLGRCSCGSAPVDVALVSGDAWVASQESTAITVIRVKD
jgi:hypothetical protein